MKELIGFDELIGSMDRLVKELPEGYLPQAVKKGAAIVQRAIISAAPVDTNTLRGALILHKEKSRTRGKVTYDVYPDPKKNTIFQKPIKNPVRSKTPYGYYPASQEYGFFTRRSDGGMTYIRGDGETVKLDKVPGKHYMRTGAEIAGEAAKSEIGRSILDAIAKEFGD